VLDRNRIQGSLRLELRDDAGRVVLVRRAHNTVLRSGAELVAQLFAGAATTPVNGMAVGTNAQPPGPPYEVAKLTTVDDTGQPLEGGTAVAVQGADVKVETLADERRVLVSLRAVVPKGAAVAHAGAAFLAEAALGALANDGSQLTKIYNRVVFDPVPKGREHELALYWEISFPYGE
jgi:hypothetical protein